MEPEGSLPHSQVPATRPYPDPDQSSPFPSHFSKIIFNIIHPSKPRSSNLSLSFGHPHQNSIYATSVPPTRDISPAHINFAD